GVDRQPRPAGPRRRRAQHPLPGAAGRRGVHPREGSVSMSILPRPVRSSVGSKYVMALTGLGLIGFVVVHMAGNLLLFAGRDALNSYAEGLKHRPALLWTARLGLLAVFLVHVALGVQLSVRNRRARPVRYVYEDTVRASWAS